MCSRRRVILRYFEAQQTLSSRVFFASGLGVGLSQSEVDLKIIGLELHRLFQVFDATFSVPRLAERPTQNQLGTGQRRVLGDRLAGIGECLGTIILQ